MCQHLTDKLVHAVYPTEYTIHLHVLHDARDAARRAGPSATVDTHYTLLSPVLLFDDCNYVCWWFIYILEGVPKMHIFIHHTDATIHDEIYFANRLSLYLKLVNSGSFIWSYFYNYENEANFFIILLLPYWSISHHVLAMLSPYLLISHILFIFSGKVITQLSLGLSCIFQSIWYILIMCIFAHPLCTVQGLSKVFS